MILFVIYSVKKIIGTNPLKLVRTIMMLIMFNILNGYTYFGKKFKLSRM